MIKVSIDSLSEGVNVVSHHGLVIFRSGHTFKVYQNNCRHQGGVFRVCNAEGNLLRCPRHGWVFDPTTGIYQNPKGIRQPELPYIAEDCALVIDDTSQEFVLFPKQPITPGELKINFFAHACAEIVCGTQRIVTDPWCVGPSFALGWWLIHRPPRDWAERIASADLIYISHNHPDHLNPWTLKKVVALNPYVPIVVPDFESRSCDQLLEGLGCRNVSRIKFREWHEMDENTKILLLPDTSGRMDSSILISYKGHSILNLVDSPSPNDCKLPQVDVLMSAFAGGASGYPVCWEEQYGESRVKELVQRNKSSMRQQVAKYIDKCQPRIFVPFAGYFTEAHPDDARIKELNLKNSASELTTWIKQRKNAPQTWVPTNLGSLDLYDFSVQQSGEAVADDEPIEYYQKCFDQPLYKKFDDDEVILSYFKWAGFRDNLVIEILESSFDFQTIHNRRIVDLLNCSLVEQRPDRDHNYLKILVRQSTFRHTLAHSLPWEEISIGFQARFYREPDVYNFRFWDHFQNHLPTEGFGLVASSSMKDRVAMAVGHVHIDQQAQLDEVYK